MDPFDEAASWSLLFACICPMLAYRNRIGRGLLLFLASGLLLVNGYLSEAVVDPLSQILGLSFERHFWDDLDLDLAFAALFPLIFGLAKLLELRARSARSRHAPRAVIVGVIWGGLVGLNVLEPGGQVVHFCIGIVSWVFLGTYVYHIAQLEYVLFKGNESDAGTTANLD